MIGQLGEFPVPNSLPQVLFLYFLLFVALRSYVDFPLAVRCVPTCNISVLTFGTSLKNCSAATPANIPNAPADRALQHDTHTHTRQLLGAFLLD